MGVRKGREAALTEGKRNLVILKPSGERENKSVVVTVSLR